MEDILRAGNVADGGLTLSDGEAPEGVDVGDHSHPCVRTTESRNSLLSPSRCGLTRSVALVICASGLNQFSARYPGLTPRAK